MQLSIDIRAVFVVLALALGLVPAASAGVRLTEAERALVQSVNAVRAENGLRPLQVDGALTRVARAYSTTMIRRGVFTHGAFAERLAGSGARGPLFGENLAWGTGAYASARNIVRNWMNSPGHRANLLRPGWTRIGIGRRTGTFMGYPGAAVVTADFAGR